MYYLTHFSGGDFEHSGSRIEFDNYEDAKKKLIEMVENDVIEKDDIENWTIKNTENDYDDGYIDESDLN